MAVVAPKMLSLRAKDGRPETQVVLRTCGDAEAPLLEPYWQKMARETVFTLQTPLFPPDFAKFTGDWERLRADPFELRLGAFHFADGRSRMVGLASLHGHRPGHPWTKHIGIFGMTVLQEFWGRGVGRALLSALEEHARTVGVLKMEAQVRCENERGVGLYTSMGYRFEGTRKRAVFIEGRFRDEYYIAKDLDAEPSV